MFKIGDEVVMTNPAFISSAAFGRSGRVKELDDNVQPGETFAVLDIDGVNYCFNVKDLDSTNSFRYHR